MGIERTTLGSLLDHTGAFGAGEKFQSYVFGSTRTYSGGWVDWEVNGMLSFYYSTTHPPLHPGVNGSSGSNRVIFSACVQEGQVALCDRNCHKSIEQGQSHLTHLPTFNHPPTHLPPPGLVNSGGIPHYLVPTRNKHGIIGPIPPTSLDAATILQGVQNNPLIKRLHPEGAPHPVYAVVTNTTCKKSPFPPTHPPAEEKGEKLIHPSQTTVFPSTRSAPSASAS